MALLIVDMLNDFSFPEGERLLKKTWPVAQNIQKLKHRAQAHNIPCIYVNDNFGYWRSSWQDIYDYCSAPEQRGCKIAEALVPTPDDYFVLKPRHSGFFNTCLSTLLRELGVQKLIVTGVAGNICVLYTVNDAYMNDFELVVPYDCTASNTKRENDFALEQMKKSMKARVVKSSSIRF